MTLTTRDQKNRQGKKNSLAREKMKQTDTRIDKQLCIDINSHALTYPFARKTGRRVDKQLRINMSSLTLTYPGQTGRQTETDRETDRTEGNLVTFILCLLNEKCQGFVKIKSIKDLLNINQSKMYKVQHQAQNLQQQ